MKFEKVERLVTNLNDKTEENLTHTRNLSKH